MPHVTLVPEVTTITTPQSDSTIPSNFTAEGTTDETGPVVGELIQGIMTLTGRTLRDGPKWAVEFTDVPPGFYEELQVRVNGGAPNSVYNLTVEA